MSVLLELLVWSSSYWSILILWLSVYFDLLANVAAVIVYEDDNG